MKFVLASYGSRGDVEPAIVLGRELLHRGHDVHLAVPPNLIGFAESAGLTAVAYGLDSQAVVETQRNYWTYFFRHPWKLRELGEMGRETQEQTTRCLEHMTTTLKSLAADADLLVGGLIFEQPPVDIAEYYDLPLATLHYFPLRPNGRLFLPFVPPPITRRIVRVNDWVSWRTMRKVEDAHRGELGLPPSTGPAPRRIVERGSLELQVYDPVCFPGLAAEWAKYQAPQAPQRPFVGNLAMASPTDADAEVLSWIAAGTPPICFGFGSIPLGSPADTVATIAAACAQLGERALVCSATTDFTDIPQFEHVKVVGTVSYAAIFPACRAVVHHGGAGTLAAGLRAGVPTLVLWTLPDQPLWGAAIKRLKVGTSRRFSSATEKTLVKDLRRILAPEYAARAREIATQMSKPAEAVRAAADLVEDFAQRKHRALPHNL